MVSGFSPVRVASNWRVSTGASLKIGFTLSIDGCFRVIIFSAGTSEERWSMVVPKTTLGFISVRDRQTIFIELSVANWT